MKDRQEVTLYGALGGGSAIVEALFTLAHIPYTPRYMEWGEFDAAEGDYSKINPMREIPAIRLPSGALLTESAAICLWIGDTATDTSLIPAPDSPLRPQFLRWLVWLVASVYPTFTYADHPERYVPKGQASEALLSSVQIRRENLWHQMEEQLPMAPFALGKQMTALDIYISVMTRWRPRREWFRDHCPKLFSTATRVDTVPALAAVWQSNFGG